MNETERKEAVKKKPITELYEKMPLKTKKETKVLLAPSWYNFRMQGPPHPQEEMLSTKPGHRQLRQMDRHSFQSRTSRRLPCVPSSCALLISLQT